MTDLHITNGDGAANLLKESAVTGDVLPWRDPMHHGPFPAGLDLDATSALRARYLAGGDKNGDALRDFQLRDTHLRAAGRYDRVVLWFEHDLLDQVQVLQILDCLAGMSLPDTRLEHISIDRFEGVENFRGLGQLSPAQIASLYDRRAPVTQDMMELAQAGWLAFRARTPMALTSFLEGDTSALPFLRAALLRHLQEYPDSRTGLSRTEFQMLGLVADGITGPVDLFVKNMDLETALFIGDWPSFSTLAGLERNGLLHCETGDFWYPPGSRDKLPAFRGQRFALTTAGRAVLNGDRDAFALFPRDQWLGGVHVSSNGPIWTWDAGASRPVMRTP